MVTGRLPRKVLLQNGRPFRQAGQLISFQVQPMGATVALQLDHSLVFPVIDIMLGGTGQCQPMTREITEIEDQIMERVARIVCQD